MEERIDIKIMSLTANVNQRLRPLEQADGEKWQKFIWLLVGAIVAVLGDLVVRGLSK